MVSVIGYPPPRSFQWHTSLIKPQEKEINIIQRDIFDICDDMNIWLIGSLSWEPLASKYGATMYIFHENWSTKYAIIYIFLNMTHMVPSDTIVKVQLTVTDCRIMELRDWDPYEIIVESYRSFVRGVFYRFLHFHMAIIGWKWIFFYVET